MNAPQPEHPFIHGVDVSKYDEKVDWPALATGGVDFAIVKLTQGDYKLDPLAQSHLTGASQAGLVTGVYHWCDPIRSDEDQLEYLLQNLAGLPVRMVCLDVEQYWSDWADWPKPRKGRKKKGRLSPERISQNAHVLAVSLQKRLPAGMPVIIYTRTSFICEYARPMLEWLPRFPLWLAQYPLLRGTPASINWSDLNGLLSTSFRPTLPLGCPAWTFRQWSGDRFRLPGISSHPDLNVFAGTRADLERFAPAQAAQEE